MTAELRVVHDAPPSPAVLLNGAADWIEADPLRWGRNWFLDENGCRCAAGAIAYVANPDRDVEEGGNPNTGDGSYDAVEVFADYLVHALGAPRCESSWESEPIETVGGWNDDPHRTPQEVVAALRGAARHAGPTERGRICRGRTTIEDPQSGGDFTCWQCSGTGDQPPAVTA